MSYTNSTGDAAGNWTFETKFDLSAYDYTTLDFTDASFWADNQMTAISLNGFDIGYTPNVIPTANNFPNSTSFLSLLNTAFDAHGLDDVNTLKFIVNNYGQPSPGGNPVALQVNIAATAATAAAVPEPAAVSLLGAVTLGFVVFRRRRRFAA